MRFLLTFILLALTTTANASDYFENGRTFPISNEDICNGRETTIDYSHRYVMVCHVYKDKDKTSHTAYMSLVDTDLKIPRFVTYTLTKDHTLGCLPRESTFHVESLLANKGYVLAAEKDYKKENEDIGHLCPAEDGSWNEDVEYDTFTFESNTAPQWKGLNRQQWERLEETARAWAYEFGSLRIWVGVIVDPNNPTIGPDKVSVPMAFWKIVQNPLTNETLAFEMPQQDIKKGDLSPWQVTIQQIEQQTGLVIPVDAALKTSKHDMWESKKALKVWRVAHRKICKDANDDDSDD